jgi:hypothetical protein
MLRAIAAAKKKNDQIDASKIADCLRCNFLPECHMMPAAIRDRRRTLRYRHLLVRQMVQMKNRVSGLLIIAAEATVRRPERISVKTSMRRTSRSLISTHPIVVRLQGRSPERVVGHFYRAKV